MARDLKVLVLGDPADASLRLLGGAKPTVHFEVSQDPRGFGEVARDAEVCFCSTATPSQLEEVLSTAPRLRWIHTRWAGLEGALVPAVLRSEAVLTNSRGVYSAALGEYVLAAILFFAKDLRRMVRSQGEGRWDVFDVDMIEGATLGIIGYGDIGRAIGRRASAFGMEVLALKRGEATEGDEVVREFLPRERLRELMTRSDYVAVAMPLTQETRHFVDRASIEAMKSTAVLINVGRGPVVDEEALAFALGGKRIRGAALDVFGTEPLPKNHVFYHLDNVLLSPHCADHTKSWRNDAVLFFLKNLERFLSGEALLNVIDKRRGY